MTFAAKTDYPNGYAPYSVAVGDLNGDGFLDLVISDYVEPGVSVRLGDGAGGFGTKTDFAIGGGSGGPAYAVAVGDLNGDGFLDVTATEDDPGRVSVLLGDGAGGFGAGTDYATGTQPYSVAVGDLNGDGFLDLVVANYGSGNVSVFPNNGDGSFGERTDVPVLFNTYSVAVGDLNGDGFLDLAVASYGSPGLGQPGSVSVLLGDGAGGFGAKTDFAMSSGPRSVAIADLNGDGFLDLVVANSNSHTVSVRLGDGAGGFGARNDFGTGHTPYSVAVGDLNADGFVDVVTANYGSPYEAYQGSVSVLLGDGTGIFGVNTDFGTGTRSQSLAIGDFNGDSRLDLAVANFDITLAQCVDPAEHDARTVRAGGADQRERHCRAGECDGLVDRAASDGGSRITGYVVTPYIGYFPLRPITFGSTATTETVTDLTSGTQYRFRVQAYNAVGIGGYFESHQRGHSFGSDGSRRADDWSRHRRQRTIDRVVDRTGL